MCKRKRQLIELSAQAHTEAACGFAADMQPEQEYKLAAVDKRRTELGLD